MMASESKSAVVKVKSNNTQVGSSKGKNDSSILKKKLESSSKQPTADSKNKAIATVTKSEVKSKTTTSSSSKSTTNTTVTKGRQKREKKEYSLAGQKYDPPEEREPLRIFYESLSKQIPTSEMAEFWLMEHGLLSPEKAKKAYEKKQRKQKQQRMGTPVKSSQSSSKPESSRKPAPQPSKNGEVRVKKKLVVDSDDDFIMSPKRRKV